MLTPGGHYLGVHLNSGLVVPPPFTPKPRLYKVRGNRVLTYPTPAPLLGLDLQAVKSELVPVLAPSGENLVASATRSGGGHVIAGTGHPMPMGGYPGAW